MQRTQYSSLPIKVTYHTLSPWAHLLKCHPIYRNSSTLVFSHWSTLVFSHWSSTLQMTINNYAQLTIQIVLTILRIIITQQQQPYTPAEHYSKEIITRTHNETWFRGLPPHARWRYDRPTLSAGATFLTFFFTCRKRMLVCFSAF